MKVTKYVCKRDTEKAGGGKKARLLMVRVGAQGVWLVIALQSLGDILTDP